MWLEVPGGALPIIPYTGRLCLISKGREIHTLKYKKGVQDLQFKHLEGASIKMFWKYESYGYFIIKVIP